MLSIFRHNICYASFGLDCENSESLINPDGCHERIPLLCLVERFVLANDWWHRNYGLVLVAVSECMYLAHY